MERNSTDGRLERYFDVGAARLGWRGRIFFLRAIFRSIGLSEVFALNISGLNSEQDIVHDLNSPIHKDLEKQFDVILDGGTLEHFFHVGIASESIHRVLKVGGAAIHLCVMNNTFNHGFYQISPTALFSTYKAYEYEDLSMAWFSTAKKFLPEGKTIETKKILETSDINHIARSEMSCRLEFGPEIQSMDKSLMGYCVRKKTGVVFKVPQQAIYSALRNDPAVAALSSVRYV